jgi:hypothetical protein
MKKEDVGRREPSRKQTVRERGYRLGTLAASASRLTNSKNPVLAEQDHAF